MEEVKLTQEQEQDLKDTLERGVAFEEMMTTKGWQFIQAYYANQIKSFMNDLMAQADKSISEFENKRQELLGLKRLLAQIDSAVGTLSKTRDEAIKGKKDE